MTSLVDSPVLSAEGFHLLSLQTPGRAGLARLMWLLPIDAGFGGTAYPQWPNALVSLLKQIPARDFEAVNTSCLMVNPNSGQARARPGCPIG